MTDTITFPPLRDLPPGRLEARKRQLLSEIRPEPGRRRLHIAASVAAAVCVAAACAVVFSGAFSNSHAHHPRTNAWPAYYGFHSSGNLAGPLPTLAHPLPVLLGAKQVTLEEAAALLGVPLVLPNTTFVNPSEVGSVWEIGKGPPSPTTVAVTFPSQGVIVGYTRPAPSDGSAAHFQAMTHSMPSPSGGSEGRVISLSGVPALAVQENSDDTGHNFGGTFFNMDGSEVGVMAHDDEATLESLALSILSQSGGS